MGARAGLRPPAGAALAPVGTPHRRAGKRPTARKGVAITRSGIHSTHPRGRRSTERRVARPDDEDAGPNVWCRRRCGAFISRTGKILGAIALTERELRGGAVPLERPRPICGCLRCTRPAPDGGSPEPSVPAGHRAVGSGGHRTSVDDGGRSGNDDATGAALHSVKSGVGPGYVVVPGRRGGHPGVATPPAACGACTTAGGRVRGGR